MDAACYETEAARLRERMRGLETETPIAYRKQNFCDYRIPAMELRGEPEAPSDVGFVLHIRKA